MKTAYVITNTILGNLFGYKKKYIYIYFKKWLGHNICIEYIHDSGHWTNAELSNCLVLRELWHLKLKFDDFLRLATHRK